MRETRELIVEKEWTEDEAVKRYVSGNRHVVAGIILCFDSPMVS